MDIQLPISTSNDIDLANVDDSIKNSIKNIISTSKGSRPFKSYIGIDYQILYSEGASPGTLLYLKSYIDVNLRNLETRIKIRDIRVGLIPGTKGDIIVEVDYTIPALNVESSTKVNFSI